LVLEGARQDILILVQINPTSHEFQTELSIIREKKGPHTKK